jgi:hypothetical protein
MKNYRWDSPTKELGSRENHSFFSQEKNGCVNHPSPRTWWENKPNMTISTKKTWKIHHMADVLTFWPIKT